MLWSRDPIRQRSRTSPTSSRKSWHATRLAPHASQVYRERTCNRGMGSRRTSMPPALSPANSTRVHDCPPFAVRYIPRSGSGPYELTTCGGQRKYERRTQREGVTRTIDFGRTHRMRLVMSKSEHACRRRVQAARPSWEFPRLPLAKAAVVCCTPALRCRSWTAAQTRRLRASTGCR